MTRSREPYVCLPVTRTGANEYALIHCIRSHSYKSRNNFLHAQLMAWAILFESRITILATVQHNWQCISWLYIDSTKEFHEDTKVFRSRIAAFRCIDTRLPRLARVVELGVGRVICLLRSDWVSHRSSGSIGLKIERVVNPSHPIFIGPVHSSNMLHYTIGPCTGQSQGSARANRVV